MIEQGQWGLEKGCGGEALKRKGILKYITEKQLDLITNNMWEVEVCSILYRSLMIREREGNISGQIKITLYN